MFGYFSVSSFTTWTLSFIEALTSSSMGTISWQGPHLQPPTPSPVISFEFENGLIPFTSLNFLYTTNLQKITRVYALNMFYQTESSIQLWKIIYNKLFGFWKNVSIRSSSSKCHLFYQNIKHIIELDIHLLNSNLKLKGANKGQMTW